MSIIEHAGTDDWMFRVTMADGRVFICGGIDQTDTAGFVHLRPCSHVARSEAGEMYFDGPQSRKGYIINERGVDVNLSLVSSVECGTS